MRSRIPFRVALIVVSSLLATSCTGSHRTTTTTTTTPIARLLTFRGGGVSFRYPSTWTPHRYVAVSSFSAAIVYLSNDPLHPPCQTSQGPGSTSTVCGDPIDQLGPDGVLVSWSEHGFPGWTFKSAQGTPAIVGGHRAKILVQRPGWCGRIGALETMSVVVERSSLPDNWWAIDACIRGPNAAIGEAQVRAMLHTAQFPTGKASGPTI